jgi:hypothetical protein
MSGYVSEEPRHWDDGFIQMLSDPAHFKITPCEVVDYSQAPAERGEPTPAQTGHVCGASGAMTVIR